MIKKFKITWRYLFEPDTEEDLTYDELRNKMKLFANLTDDNLDRLDKMIIQLNDPCIITIERIKDDVVNNDE